MHRDIARHLILLAVVRLLVAAAQPAPHPWRGQRPGAFPRTDRSAASPVDRVTGDVTLPTTVFSRPRSPANQRRRPESDVTWAWRPGVTAGSRAEPVSGRAAPEDAGPRSGGPGHRPRRKTHRGRRSTERKRGPRRHHRTWTSSEARTLKVCGINIQSLKPKTVELYDEIMRFNYDFIGLSETWLKPATPNRLLPFSGYVLKRSDRRQAPLGHGGVAILYRENFVQKNVDAPPSDNQACKLESMWSLFTCDRQRIIVASVYRPPRRTVAALEADFECLESQYQHVIINHPDCPVVIIGDLNCDWLDNASPSHRFLRGFVSKYSLEQLISTPTYPSGSVLDVIIVNRDFVIRSGTRFCHFSPHHFTRAMFKLSRPRLRPRVVECRSFKHFNMCDFDADLLATDWSCVFSAANVTDAWTSFLDLFRPIVNQHAPVRSMTLRNPNAPPLSEAARALLADRSEALRRWGHGSDQYRAANRLARAAFRSEQRRHIGERVMANGRGSVWREARNVLGNKKCSARIPPSVSPDAMNSFFTGVGPRVAAELGAQGPPPALPTRLPRVGACAFRPSPISLSTLHHIISSMHNSPARGLDGLCIRIFKLSFNCIGDILLYLVNSCIVNSDIPTAWKHSIVHPIHKTGDPENPSNYRPISILPVISKIVERAVQRQLYHYLNSNNLLSSSQHGFRSHHSTETALTFVTDHILSATDQGLISVLCLIDLSKCFDVIDHPRLLDKLALLGVDTSWFENYLHGHTQSVCITGADGTVKLSSPLAIDQGVFQGSSLGPVLFCAFVNDLCLYVGDAQVVQYADDTQVIVSGPKSTLSDLCSRLEYSLACLSDYFQFNGLKVNVSKFELIVFGSKHNLRNLPTIQINCRGTCLTPSSEVRNLGLTFDQYLSWDAHVQHLSQKCCGILVALSHIRHFLPPTALPDIVTALVVSHVRYCLTVYGSGSAGNLARIQKILNFAARVISGRRKFDHVSDVRHALGWLNSSQLFQYQSLSLLHKIIRTQEPACFATQLRLNRDDPSHTHSTRQDNHLQLPHIRSEAGRRRFMYRVPHQYNQLPDAVRDLCGPRFRKHLRSHLRAV